MDDASLNAASKLCANSLPIVFFACEGGRYRACGLNLLAKYLDIGGPQPVKWILRCGVLDILPAVLKWTSPHEASVAIFLLQRLMLSEDGPRLLIQPLDTLHKPPMHLFGDFLCQHISESGINLPPDTVAAVLFLYSKAILDANWALPDGLKAQFQQILNIALGAEDSLVRTWASFALAACPPPDVEIQRKVRQSAVADPVQNVRTAASFAIWHWQAPEDDYTNGSLTLGEEDCGHIDFISQASKDASYLVRAFAFALAMDFVLSHRHGVVEYIKQLAVNNVATTDEGNLSPHFSFGPIISTLASGCRDPLRFLQNAVQDFLTRFWADERTCDADSWSQVFPDMPQVMTTANTEKTAEKTQASRPPLTHSALPKIGMAQDTLGAQTERPMTQHILAWRHRQECYFHETRLTLTAYEAGSRAMSSWTKESLEIQTSERARLLQFHPRVPILAYGDSTGYRLFDYAKQRTIARRSLPIHERGIVALHFVDLGCPTLDVIELSAAGIVRVVKRIEEESFHEESQVVQGFRLGHFSHGERIVASWNAIKLELRVGVGSRQSLQIWDLASAKRKADVMTGCAAGITCMDNEPMRGNLSLLGFNDGTVALFDVRQQSRHCVARWPEGHSETVLSCSLTASQEIASIGQDGALNVWDLRVPNQPICTSSGLLQLPSRGLGAAAMSSTSVFAHATAESTAMVFHPQEACLAVAESKKIVIRTARSER
ncbi:hypothetical protein QFC20_007285 [Naganishia adeliensis]|uniref:Uncharacterized protein n=1 Tax=Naganishia adeliensis TaxID=92952 RepID=A0ACC2V155_9TREE|nr:hypothetical protein QFC20_007285 [Naganishia adeliensis]